jgi:trimeric autotransporter adhesin
MNKTIIQLFFISLLAPTPLFSQVLLNQGGINVSSGSYINIQGSYQNEGSGAMTLTGTVKLTGSWTNNGDANAITDPGTAGEVVFSGTGTTQTIGGTYTTFEFPKLTINSGAVVNVTAGDGVTAHGASTFDSPLVLKSTYTSRPKTATYIDNGTVSGNINAEFYYASNGLSATATGRTWYFSSPINAATSSIFNGGSTRNLVYWYNSDSSVYHKITNTSTVFNPMQGYQLRSAVSNTYDFIGSPNTGSITTDGLGSSTQEWYYLMGNPFPSILDWDLAERTSVDGTIWYRTMNTSGLMVYDTYSAEDEIGTNNNGTAAVDGKIPPMQSFWVYLSAGSIGSVTFNNSMRSHDWGNSQFIKSGKINDFDAFRIAVYSPNGSKDEQIIMHKSAAKDSIDYWDACKLFVGNDSIAEIFTRSTEKKALVIQVIGEDSLSKTLPLGLIVKKSGNYKFIADLSKVQSEYTYSLEDKLLDSLKDLGTNPVYKFSSGVVSDTLVNTRFVIHINYSGTKSSTASQTSITDQSDIAIYSSGNQIFVKNCESGSEIFIYDVLGRPVFMNKATSDFEVINSNFHNGIYVVKVIDHGKIKSRIVPISF